MEGEEYYLENVFDILFNFFFLIEVFFDFMVVCDCGFKFEVYWVINSLWEYVLVVQD